jgi:hypothetical protein
MKIQIVALLVLLNSSAIAQQTEKVEIPKGVVYKYCDSVTYDKAKSLLTQELSDTPHYALNKGICFIGPVLWGRYEKVPELKNIKGGNMTILGYKKETSTGKLTQTNEGIKLVWDHLRSEIHANDFKLRKATAKELKYFWSVISFDIEEPLIIIETSEHNYILNLSPKDYTLVWLDEAPRN